MVVPRPGGRGHLKAAAEGGEAVGHVPQAGAERGTRGVEPGAVVRDAEGERPATARSVMAARDAAAYLAMFCSASMQQK